ncbi:Methylmalonate semialdehyde dehydrogenase [acylating] [Pseudobythopirellula maris]|uniref:methylmalonate-semialdehyde dehydrogenase (CoA acylating) n=1 Tax=Pseudobythopirellula maris TaxID=2527991 RepID=A0A5C5ZQZ7_9BACT|nr:CoA-acylating methylmalonate-semialdehyde dehydrogenase [Pseudobythopirellula maris]TWT89909.1 Methylmalonate semialdehyde dehydrogenase [acylating] [Pseudobythopirellula maris]
MPAQAPTLTTVPVLSGGKWSTPAADRYEEVYNPSTGQVIARTPLLGASETAEIIEAAAAALPAWAATPVVERARVMFRYRQLMEEHFEELSVLVTREHGKTLAEARAEVQRGLEMVEFAAGIPAMLMGDSLPDIARGVDAECVRHPVGVCAGITPYNFPNMVPLWMFPVAITCGNTFVLKPSEKVPLSAVRLGELLIEAGLPDGVLSIAHGAKECVETLLTHPKVAAISFVGSTPVAKIVYETGTRHGKRVQSAGGAKNHLVIMPDADMDQTVKQLAASAYGCAGQRCMAGSLAVAVGAAGDPLVEGLVTHGAAMTVGASDPGVNAAAESLGMGPVIRKEHRDRVASYLDIAAEDGATVALDGRKADGASNGFVIGPSVVDRVAPAMRVAKEEIFGPVLSVSRVDSLDEALALGDGCEYGNGAVIFTQSGYAAREFKQRFNAGMIGVNVGVPAPMAWFPFTGWNQSFFGDLHVQGKEGIQFYTRQKVTLTRWPRQEDSHLDPVWAEKRK